MTTYTIVQTAPEKLDETTLVIYKPNFLEEIRSTKARRGVTKLTTASSLRDIFMAITNKYDNTVNPFHLKLNKYEGISYEKDEDLIEVVYRIIRDNNLNLIESAVDKILKSRSHKIQTIYYISDDLQGIGAFTKNGISAIKYDKKGKKEEKSEDLV